MHTAVSAYTGCFGIFLIPPASQTHPPPHTTSVSLNPTSPSGRVLQPRAVRNAAVCHAANNSDIIESTSTMRIKPHTNNSGHCYKYSLMAEGIVFVLSTDAPYDTAVFCWPLSQPYLTHAVVVLHERLECRQVTRV